MLPTAIPAAYSDAPVAAWMVDERLTGTPRSTGVEGRRMSDAPTSESRT